MTPRESITTIWRDQRCIDYIGGFENVNETGMTKGWILFRHKHTPQQVQEIVRNGYVALCAPMMKPFMLKLSYKGADGAVRYADKTEFGMLYQPFLKRYDTDRYKEKWRRLVTADYDRWAKKKYLKWKHLFNE